VDDAYLMIHSWQRITKELKENPVKGDCAAYRLAQVLSDTGPAIMISALTNMSADAVGAFTSSPEITLLCYGNAACIFVDFIYQITLYSAVMVIVGQFELESERTQTLTQRLECGVDDVAGSLDKSSMASFRDRINDQFGYFLDNYVSLVTNKVFDMFMIVVWVIFLVVSIKGITQMPINLTPKKLFSRDSSLVEV
ncbi:hypothetical protein TELCIR_18184, partial [Teladorsagia circumcincta]